MGLCVHEKVVEGGCLAAEGYAEDSAVVGETIAEENEVCGIFAFMAGLTKSAR